MSKELNRHKKSDKIKWIFTGVAFVIVFVLFAGLCMQLFAKGEYKPSEWFQQNEQSETQSDNAVVSNGTNHGVHLVSEKISREMFAEYGISPQVETAYTLTATLSPSSADVRGVNWSVSWANAQSEWATDKTVEEYVSLSPSEDTSSCTVSCLQDFGEQIVVTATSQDNVNVKATCVVDYVQRIKEFIFKMPNISSTTTSFTYSVVSSAYTIPADISVGVSDKMELTSVLRSKVSETSNAQSGYDYMEYYSPSIYISGKSIVIRKNYYDYYDEAHYEIPDGLTGCFYAGFGLPLLEERFSLGDMVSWFKQSVLAVDDVHATFDVTYSATYNGTVYSSGTKTIECRFNGSTLHIPVERITLNRDSIIF